RGQVRGGSCRRSVASSSLSSPFSGGARGGTPPRTGALLNVSPSIPSSPNNPPPVRAPHPHLRLESHHKPEMPHRPPNTLTLLITDQDWRLHAGPHTTTLPTPNTALESLAQQSATWFHQHAPRTSPITLALPAQYFLSATLPT